MKLGLSSKAAIAACGAGSGVNLYLLVTFLQKRVVDKGLVLEQFMTPLLILVNLDVTSEHCLGPFWIVFKSGEKEQSGLLHMIYSGLWVCCIGA